MRWIFAAGLALSSGASAVGVGVQNLKDNIYCVGTGFTVLTSDVGLDDADLKSRMLSVLNKKLKLYSILTLDLPSSPCEYSVTPKLLVSLDTLKTSSGYIFEIELDVFQEIENFSQLVNIYSINRFGYSNYSTDDIDDYIISQFNLLIDDFGSDYRTANNLN